MATLTTARARIESLDAPAAFGRYDDVYQPQSAPMPFDAAPVRDAGRAGVRAAARRVQRLNQCPRCYSVRARNGSCDC